MRFRCEYCMLSAFPLLLPRNKTYMYMYSYFICVTEIQMQFLAFTIASKAVTNLAEVLP